MSNKLIRNSISALVILVMAASVFALPIFTDNDVYAAKKMKLNKKKATITEGKTLKLKVINKGRKKVKWSSNKKSVATVSKSGKVKAKKKGKATITAKIGRTKLKCTITVQKPPKGTKQNPAIATDGVTIKTPDGTMYFKVTNVYKGIAAVSWLKANTPFYAVDETRFYTNRINTHNLVVFLYDVKAVKGYKTSPYLVGGEIINSTNLYDQTGIKIKQDVDAMLAPLSGNKYVGQNSFKLKEGETAYMALGLSIPKSATWFMNPITTVDIKDYWVRYNY